MQKPLSKLNRRSLSEFFKSEAPAKAELLDEEIFRVIEAVDATVLHTGVPHKLQFNIGYIKRRNSVLIFKTNNDNLSRNL